MKRLTGPMAAARAGITYNAWKLAKRTKRGRPRYDGIDQLTGQLWWWDTTIDRWASKRPPSHAEIIANQQAGRPQRVARATVRRHLRRHEARACSCYTTPKGLRI